MSASGSAPSSTRSASLPGAIAAERLAEAEELGGRARGPLAAPAPASGPARRRTAPAPRAARTREDAQHPGVGAGQDLHAGLVHLAQDLERARRQLAKERAPLRRLLGHLLPPVDQEELRHVTAARLDLPGLVLDHRGERLLRREHRRERGDHRRHDSRRPRPRIVDRRPAAARAPGSRAGPRGRARGSSGPRPGCPPAAATGRGRRAAGGLTGRVADREVGRAVLDGADLDVVGAAPWRPSRRRACVLGRADRDARPLDRLRHLGDRRAAHALDVARRLQVRAGQQQSRTQAAPARRISRRQRNSSSWSPPMSRSVVTPLATNSCSAEPRVLETCVCMSTRPGIRNLPRPSTRRASAGMRSVAEAPTAAMRCPSTTTVAPRSGGGSRARDQRDVHDRDALGSRGPGPARHSSATHVGKSHALSTLEPRRRLRRLSARALRRSPCGKASTWITSSRASRRPSAGRLRLGDHAGGEASSSSMWPGARSMRPARTASRSLVSTGSASTALSSAASSRPRPSSSRRRHVDVARQVQPRLRGLRAACARRAPPSASLGARGGAPSGKTSGRSRTADQRGSGGCRARRRSASWIS